MASVAKFDTWQNNAGVKNNVIRQVLKDRYASYTSLSGAGPTALWTLPRITRTVPNSNFLVLLNVYIGYSGNTNGNPDGEDPGLALYRDGSPVSTGHGSYSGFFWYCDVPFTASGTYGGRYDTQVKSFQYMESPVGEVGTTFKYELWGRGTLYFNRIYETGRVDTVSSVTIMEIEA